jgi:hypothetical protein
MRILRVVNGRTLPCGCLIGIYETYGAEIVAIVDAKGSDCTNVAHQVDSPVDAHPGEALPPTPLENQLDLKV